MMPMDGWMETDRGAFFDATLQLVGEWVALQRDGGLETWPGGFCGGALTPTSSTPRSGHRPHLDDATIDRRLVTGNMPYLFPCITLPSCFNTSLLWPQ
jgi:hypothetical protein